MAASTITTVIRVIQTPAAVLPRQVITQTITYADYTTTAVVTLGPGDPSSAPPVAPVTSSSSDSQGLPSAYIGIIVGSILGALLLALFLWVCCVIRRHKEKEEYEYQYWQDTTEIQRPGPAYLPEFPMSIPPPAEPTYRAISPERRYTANKAGRRGSSLYGYY